MTAKLVWVLVFMLNGSEHRTEPMIGEACVINLLSIGYQGDPPYCLNTDDGTVMKRPPECPFSGSIYYCNK